MRRGFRNYPYQNLNDLNLDYVLNEVRRINKEFDEFVEINKLKFADPFQWDITKPYTVNTMVYDENTGYAYVTIANAPAGVQIGNDKYWLPILNLGAFLEALKSEVIEDVTELNEFKNVTLENVYPKNYFTQNVYHTGKLADILPVGRTPQGFCYNPIKNTFVFGSSGDGASVIPIIIETNGTFDTVQNTTYDQRLGHVNDICYNEDENKYYVATGVLGAVGCLVEVDASTLEVIRAIDIETLSADPIWSVCYNPSEKKYFIQATNDYFVYTLRDDFTIENVGNTDLTTLWGDTMPTGIVPQSLEFKDGALLLCCALLDEARINYVGAAICVLNKNGDLLSYTNFYTSAQTEAEAITNVGKSLFMLQFPNGGKTFEIVKVFNFSSIGKNERYEERIAQNTDLNGIIRNGLYYSPYGAWSQTLLNCPVLNGFTLEVTLNYLTIAQTVRAFDATNYVRTSNDGGQTWTNWTNDKAAAVTEIETGITTGGLDDADNAIVGKWYFVYASETANVVGNGMLYTRSNASGSVKFQWCFTTSGNGLHQRVYASGAWSSWSAK